MKKNNYSSLLKEKFLENEIEWKVKKSGMNGTKPYIMAVPYIKARAIQERLDEIFGFENWEDTYRKDGKSWICTLKVTIEGKTVIKENGADETNYEATKGGISDSFKRVAASGYGIGRYLYYETFKFVECSTEKKEGFTEKAKVKDGNKNITVYWKIPKLGNEYSINAAQIKVLKGLQQKANISDEKIIHFLKIYGIKEIKNVNNIQFEKIINKLNKTIKENSNKKHAV